MRCAVSNCNHDSTETLQGITYHRFPTEPQLREAWLEGLHLTAWEPELDSVVCSSHFSKEDLLVSSSGLCTLRPGSVPFIDVRVCRICFNRVFRLYSIKTYKILYKAYENLTGLLLDNEANLPPYLCSECTQQLLNYDRFRTSSLRAHLILLEIIKTHGFITQELIQSVKEIQSPENLNVINSVNNTDLVVELTKENLIDTKRQIGIAYVPKLRNDIPDNIIRVENYAGKQDFLNTDDLLDIDEIECMSSCLDAKTVHGIKIENEGVIEKDAYSNTENKGSEDILHQTSVHKNIALDGVKVENEIVIKQEGYNFEDATNKDNICSSFKDIANLNVKVEDDAVINHNQATNSDICLPENIDDYDIKVKKHRLINLDGATEVSKNRLDIQHEKTYEAAGSTKDKRKSKKILNNSTQAKVDKHQNQKSKEEGVVLVNNKLSCDLCPFTTNRELQLLSHLKAHAASVTYRCNMCSYITLRRRNLICHVKAHSEVKSFSCDVCHKTFNENSILTKHKRIHSRVKPYSCDICNKRFIEKFDLTMHMSTHSDIRPYSCKLCDKAFNRKLNLTTHLRTHSGEKPFRCKICDKLFTVKSTLTKHMRIHTGVRPYSCDICNKTFTARFSLTTHMNLHS